jgi:hypothetical protein
MPSTSDYKIKHDELQILINSRTPIITVETSEEDRLEKLLLDNCHADGGAVLREWAKSRAVPAD